MTADLIKSILSARRLSGRDAFHRYVFELMLRLPMGREEMFITPSDVPDLTDILTRWVVEAPVGDTHGSLRLLAIRKPLKAIIAATGQPFRDFFCNALGLDKQGLLNPHNLPPWKQKKLAALADASLVTANALEPWQVHNQTDSKLAVISCLDACPLDEEAALATADIGRMLLTTKPINLPLIYLEQLQNSAFFVSYLADADRHEFKRAIVRQAKAMVNNLPLPKLYNNVGKPNHPPRLTIIGELLFPQHAMFRCYAETISGLKSPFHVTLIADEPTRCPDHSLISHNQVYFPPHERDVERLARLVVSTRPDIILYPSVGMSYWTFALSLLRLAPLQLMSVGHPAPSCSEEIDGTLVYEELASACLSEYGRMITYGNQPLPISPLDLDAWQPQKIKANKKPVIAINAARIKLTPSFLRIVDQVISSASADTQLHFYPNTSGAELSALKSDLLIRYPQAKVHPMKPYLDYMNSLSEADLILQSFPFGGTNTVMDALTLGVPLVCMETDDLPAAVDPVLLKYAGLGTLCAKTPDEYVGIATRLLNSQAERENIAVLVKGALEKLRTVQLNQRGRTMADAVLETWKAGFQ